VWNSRQRPLLGSDDQRFTKQVLFAMSGHSTREQLVNKGLKIGAVEVVADPIKRTGRVVAIGHNVGPCDQGTGSIDMEVSNGQVYSDLFLGSQPRSPSRCVGCYFIFSHLSVCPAT